MTNVESVPFSEKPDRPLSASGADPSGAPDSSGGGVTDDVP